jgi:UDP-N-acetyl-D-glucosamine dehydrogenase
VHPVASAEVAEAAKILENVYRAVNIALVNELKLILERMGIDIWEVVEAAATKPYGFQAFRPGPGLGGHCIPIDPFDLTWRAQQVGSPTRFIELAGEINTAMPAHVVARVERALEEGGSPIARARVLVLGVAYKAEVDDSRETPAAEIITRLREAGAQVEYHDPYVPTFPRMRNYRIALDSVPLTAERLAACDCALVVTDHRAIDWDLVAEHARLVVDTRNALAGRAVRGRLVRA